MQGACSEAGSTHQVVARQAHAGSGGSLGSMQQLPRQGPSICREGQALHQLCAGPVQAVHALGAGGQHMVPQHAQSACERSRLRWA